MTSFFESDLRKSLLALAVAGALTACGGDDSGETSTLKSKKNTNTQAAA